MLTIAAAYAEVVGVIAFLAFVTTVFRAQPSGALVRLARTLATVLGAVIGIAWAAIATVHGGEAFGIVPVEAVAARNIPGIGFAITLLFGGIVAAAMIASISLHWRHTREMPSWVVWLGFAAAFILLLSVEFLPMAALPLWALVVGIVLLRRKPLTSGMGNPGRADTT